MLQRLEYLRKEWNDEIPTKVLHSTDEDNKYKVRRTWFTAIVSIAENLIIDRSIQDDLRVTATNELIEKYTSDDFIKQPLTTKDDIDYANTLLDIILNK